MNMRLRDMLPDRKWLAAAMLFLTLFFSPRAALSMEVKEEPTGSQIAIDIVLLRPLGLTATVLGSAVFIVGLPFTIPTGSVGLSAQKLIVEPFKFTFTRPIGSDIEDYQGSETAP